MSTLGWIILIVVLILLFRSPLVGSTGPSEAHPLLPALAELDVTRLEFVGSDGKRLNVRREGEGCPGRATGHRTVVRGIGESRQARYAA